MAVALTSTPAEVAHLVLYPYTSAELFYRYCRRVEPHGDHASLFQAGNTSLLRTAADFIARPVTSAPAPAHRIGSISVDGGDR